MNSTPTTRYTYVAGDLNFRVERNYDDAMSILKQIKQSSGGHNSKAYEILTKHDQLSMCLKKRAVFHGFTEAAKVTFAPTFKYVLVTDQSRNNTHLCSIHRYTPDTDNYDVQLQRVPSWTDRVLYKTKRPGHVRCIAYNSVPQIRTSDHRPVFAVFEVLVKPGRDNVPLNAGLFSRDVYLEAIRRRAAEPDKARRDSLVCSIS